jgi:carboxylate-amine ligase
MVPQAEAFSLGVEEELQIINPLTRGLESRAEHILAELTPTLGDEVRSELHLSMIETVTPICRSLAEVRAEITRLRREVMGAATRNGCRIASAGTHPFSCWPDQEITPKPRYQEIAWRYQQLANESVIFGCHVHVGINDRDMAVQVLNRARIWLAPLLALTANSPFWQGLDTGYASYRYEMWLNWPTAGPPNLFQSRADFDAMVRAMVATGGILDASNLYWDLRLPARFPTIEFRIMDACMTVDEVVMVAGLARALVLTCYEQALREAPFPAARTELLRAAHWRASRYGLSEDLVDVGTERAIPAVELIEHMLNFARPALEAFGDWSEVATIVRETLRRGNGAERQRAVFREAGCLLPVVDLIVQETARGVGPI